MERDLSANFRRCLIELDVETAKRLWKHACPHLPQPADDHQTLVVLHRARTEAESVPLRARAYSHKWLLDEGYPSGLPDHLKPRAERMYPRIAAAVGISVNARSPLLKPIVVPVRTAMQDAVLEAEADGKLLDSEHVKRRMREARARVLKKLGY